MSPLASLLAIPVTALVLLVPHLTQGGELEAWRSGFEEPAWPEAWSPSRDDHQENRRVVQRADGGHALRVTSSRRNNGFTGMGVLLRTRLTDLGLPATDAARLRYSVYLPSGWDPWDGGKLPGLAGSVGKSVDDAPGGGNFDGRGWSGRLMWDDGRVLKTYLYVHAAAGKNINDNVNRRNGRIYGISIVLRRDPDPARPWSTDGEALQLRPGWNRVELLYRMNTAGRPNGVFRAWLNGELGVDLRDVVYRTPAHPGIGVDHLWFDSFYGGERSNLSDQTWYFDDVVIDPRP